MLLQNLAAVFAERRVVDRAGRHARLFVGWERPWTGEVYSVSFWIPWRWRP